MPDPNRALSDGKIAVLKRLKLAYDDAEDAVAEPRQFSVRKGELMADGATSSDLLWLLKTSYVEHVREVTRGAEPRRQFRAANAFVLSEDSCFFLTYAGKVYVERNGLHRAAAKKPDSGAAARRTSQRGGNKRSPANRRGRPSAASSRLSPQSPAGQQDKPAWNAAEGKLYWRRKEILRLVTWADAERAILDAFENAEDKWTPLIADPFVRDTVGNDPTKRRRSAIHNLNRRLGENSPIVFFSTHDGRIGWRPTGL